jgi:hypothetical protein
MEVGKHLVWVYCRGLLAHAGGHCPPVRPKSRRGLRLCSPGAVYSAVAFGFAWGFGAICFGGSVESLGVSIANSLVIGLSSALGSLVPVLLTGALRLSFQQGDAVYRCSDISDWRLVVR